MSPVLSQPSGVRVYFVASGLFQYPFMMFGARIQSSPRASGPRVLISSEFSSATIIPSQFALSSPTEFDRDMSRESQPSAAHVVLFRGGLVSNFFATIEKAASEETHSVIPQPCFMLRLFPGHSFSILAHTSRPSGAAPEPRFSIELKS